MNPNLIDADKYYTLVGFHGWFKRWEIIFGDYIRSSVQEEKTEMNRNLSEMPYTKLKIFKSGSDQISIDKKLSSLNEKKKKLGDLTGTHRKQKMGPLTIKWEK